MLKTEAWTRIYSVGQDPDTVKTVLPVRFGRRGDSIRIYSPSRRSAGRVPWGTGMGRGGFETIWCCLYLFLRRCPCARGAVQYYCCCNNGNRHDRPRDNVGVQTTYTQSQSGELQIFKCCSRHDSLNARARAAAATWVPPAALK